MTNEEQTNRNALSKSIALTEDITRTTQRIHSILWNLMNNPGDIENIASSINDLHSKVTTLKGIKINAPLVVKEIPTVPGISDIAPTEDPDYVDIIIAPPKVTEDTSYKDISVDVSDRKKAEYKARKEVRLQKMKENSKKKSQKVKVKKTKKQSMPSKPFKKNFKSQLTQNEK